jgi:hypothetical protein
MIILTIKRPAKLLKIFPKKNRNTTPIQYPRRLQILYIARIGRYMSALVVEEK